LYLGCNIEILSMIRGLEGQILGIESHRAMIQPGDQ
jgi:hypothetical protein